MSQFAERFGEDSLGFLYEKKLKTFNEEILKKIKKPKYHSILGNISIFILKDFYEASELALYIRDEIGHDDELKNLAAKENDNKDVFDCKISIIYTEIIESKISTLTDMPVFYGVDFKYLRNLIKVTPNNCILVSNEFKQGVDKREEKSGKGVKKYGFRPANLAGKEEDKIWEIDHINLVNENAKFDHFPEYEDLLNQSRKQIETIIGKEFDPIENNFHLCFRKDNTLDPCFVQYHSLRLFADILQSNHFTSESVELTYYFLHLQKSIKVFRTVLANSLSEAPKGKRDFNEYIKDSSKYNEIGKVFRFRWLLISDIDRVINLFRHERKDEQTHSDENKRPDDSIEKSIDRLINILLNRLKFIETNLEIRTKIVKEFVSNLILIKNSLQLEQNEIDQDAVFRFHANGTISDSLDEINSFIDDINKNLRDQVESFLKTNRKEFKKTLSSVSVDELDTLLEQIIRNIPINKPESPIVYRQN